jgi:hypothetical protein
MEKKYYDIERKWSARVTVTTSATGIARNLCETLKLPKPTPPRWRSELAAVPYFANSNGYWRYSWLFRYATGCSKSSYIIIQGAKIVDFFHTPKGNTENLRTHCNFLD